MLAIKHLQDVNHQYVRSGIKLKEQKRTILSGIQPSNSLHLGNYLGAVRNWREMQQEYSCFFMMVDLHAITVNQDPETLKESSYMGIASYIAAGLDPEKSVLFLQSHVPPHAELAWVFTCFSYMGELNRMTQFKDKSQKQGQNIPVGLFAYPNLMASDILLYQPHYVPVGNDQKQHVEHTRNLAERMNNRYQKEIFKIPEPFIGKLGARVMDLQNPSSKMSKSAENPKGAVFLTDTDKQIMKKIKSAVTDSGTEVTTYAEASPGLRNLIDINSALSNRSHEDVANEFSGKMYGFLKVATGELVVETIAPIREKMNQLLNDKSYLNKILKTGADSANSVAQSTLDQVYDAIGFIPRIP